MKTILILALGVLVVLCCSWVATFAEGVDAGSFLRDGVGARAFGLGGAFVAVADDVSAPFWNPAGVAGLTGIHAGGMYTNRFGQDILFQSLGATMTFPGLGGGVSMARSSIEGIPFYGEHEGESFADTQTVWLATLGCDLGYLVPRLQSDSGSAFWIGGNLKTYTHGVLGGSGTGIGLDLGVLVHLSFPWGEVSVGLVGQDVGGTTVRWTGTPHNPTNEVPWINKVGASFTLLGGALRLNGQGDVAVGRSKLNRAHLGAEVWPIPEIGARAGAAVSADGTWEFGYGGSVVWQGLTLDYSYVPHSVLGGSHILSAQFNF